MEIRLREDLQDLEEKREELLTDRQKKRLILPVSEDESFYHLQINGIDKGIIFSNRKKYNVFVDKNVGREHYNAIRKGIAEELGVPEEKILISSFNDMDKLKKTIFPKDFR